MIKMPFYAWEPASRPRVLQHDQTCSSHVYHQNVVLCLGTFFETSKSQIFPVLLIEPHFVRKGRSRPVKIALFRQFLTIEFHFVRDCRVS